MELVDGEVLVLFTDGINECMNPAGEILGVDRLLNDIKASQTKSPAAIGKEICQITNRHLEGNIAHDDMCLVCFGRGFE